MMSQGKDIATQIKDSMVLWYDIERMLDGKLDESTDANTYMSSNPTLVDLSGNGYDATCTGFAWSGNSGIVGYSNLFKLLNVNNTDVLTLNVGSVFGGISMLSYTVAPTRASVFPASRIRVTGITANRASYPDAKVRLSYFYRTHNGIEKEVIITADGEYDLPVNFVSETGNGSSTGFSCFDSVEEVITATDPITVELLDTYSTLVSDGTDDFCITYGLPALTADKGFTVVAKREVTNGDEILTAFASKQADADEQVGAFTIERGGVDATYGYRMQVGTFGLNNKITSGNKTGVMYCTSTDYNGETTLIQGDHVDSDLLVLFRLDGSANSPYYGKYSLYSFILFNRDLTQEEIEWVKTNLIEGDYKF